MSSARPGRPAHRRPRPWTGLALVGAAVLVALAPPAGADEVDRLSNRAAAERAAADEAARLAHATLEASVAAQQRADAAAQAALQQQAVLREATRRVTSAREDLADHVARLYRSGMGSATLAAADDLVGTHDANSFFDALAMVRRVTGAHDASVRRLARAEAEQSLAAAAARAAHDDAAAAARQAQAAHEAAARASDAAAARLAVTHRQLAWAEQVRAATAAAGAPVADGATAPSAPSGSCTAAVATGARNGQLPLTALCPVLAAPGHLLRPDAAAALDALADAYAAAFGRPLCVTDSYRALAEQVAVALAKPQLAATPGRSQHGWGVAVDLCGGVQSFGTPEHRWLKEHAPAFGWFHPRWAQVHGSRPEPWHWEFAGTPAPGPTPPAAVSPGPARR